MTNRPQAHSFLTLPASEYRYWEKLLTLIEQQEICAVILDLEDSISISSKEIARDMVLAHIEELSEIKISSPVKIMLRINPIGTEFYNNDIVLAQKMLSNRCIDTIVVPKVANANEIKKVHSDIPGMSLFVALETIEGYSNMKEILSSGQIEYVVVGAEDLSADIGISRPLVFYKNRILEKIATDVATEALIHNISFVGNVWPFASYPELLPAFQQEIMDDIFLKAIGKVIFHPYQTEFVNFYWGNSTYSEGYKKATLGRQHFLHEQEKMKGLSVGIKDFKMVDTPEDKRIF